MTEEEFAQLSTEEKQALMRQMSQVKEMRVDYGSMENPYGQAPQQQRVNAPKRQNRQEPQMPQQRSGSAVTPSQIMRPSPPSAGEAGGPLTTSEAKTMAQSAAQAAQSPISLNPSAYDAIGNSVKKKKLREFF